jgi:ankyrin repeat protein
MYSTVSKLAIFMYFGSCTCSQVQGVDGLMRAVRENNLVEAERILKEEGISVEEKDADGESSIIQAIHFNKTGMVRLFIENGANPNAKDIHTGRTILMMSASLGYKRMVKLLLEKSASVKVKCKQEKTAIDYAFDASIKNILENVPTSSPEQIQRNSN